ncbi:UDP-N-acetylmuramoyl-tripeptide--D-alanyl-D-alanine ligase [Ichthyenterobacterium sp. W332]|uniref:UDP-N-acetylmuramoyl-tripeptide--D-alanyl-D-alanine ligase n=1 Tax=Microcosmobacter mediterraneus TaxID=3075607 RepID=A0ABU2YN02_9FLAO|nr:UDP-N-acetylmuramoyl-tripeptide--D-alanyl-D-alanine ligase [Ichthyenterobacterium sp. W332]MDT0558448.1 UDP-N-acetylmuramoyl-tripeptide--D-alanyl-D-alanine ligase [Ichthyenterobacterium sp. W332]
MTAEKLHHLFLKSSQVCTDSRTISKDCMFFALKGDNFNGNLFAKEALNKGAKYAIVDENIDVEKENIIKVNDVLKSLQSLATYHRIKLGIPVIALTGSNGKTTTKELINCILSTTYNTSATQGNFNNHIGVPLTLLNFNSNTEIGIIEMGANHQKEIEFLCEIALPDIGLITNFGKAHLEGFGGFEGVIKGKTELYSHLKANEKPIVTNLDDKLQVKQLANYKNTIAFSASQSKNVLEIIQTEQSNNFVTLKYLDTLINSNLIGNYNFTNLAYSITIGHHYKVDKEDIKKAIQSYVPKNNRSQIIKKNSNSIILDAYNANPTSMKAALDNLKNNSSNSKFAILGDMFELGDDAKKEHQYIAEYAEKNTKVSTILVGENFYTSKLSKPESLKFKQFSDLVYYLDKNPIKKSTILIKGSRGMALERLLDII